MRKSKNETHSLGLMIKQVVIPERVVLPKVKRCPIFHPKEEIPSDREIMKEYCMQFIRGRVEVNDDALMDIVLKEEFVNFIKLRLMTVSSLDDVANIVITKVNDELQLNALTCRVEELRRKMFTH